MPPKFIPEMDETTAEQEELITQLLSRVVEPLEAKEGGELPRHLAELDQADRRIVAYKFLVARKWDIAKAEEMWKGSLAFKAKYKTDELGHFPAAFPIGGYNSDELNAFLGLKPREPNEIDRIQRTIFPTYKAAYHKWDKRGHPVLIERTGRVNVKKIVQYFKSLSPVGTVYTQPCVDYHVHYNEVGARLVRFQDKTFGAVNGSRVLGVTVVMDVAGLGFGHMYKPALELLKQVFACDANNYPEGLHALYIVNCPTMITFAFSVVKIWLDPRVIAKITFLKPHETKAGLLEVIDAANLPTFLGGDDTTCEIEAFDESEIDATGADETLTEEIQVPAGKCIVKNIAVEAGEEVAWEFSLDAKTIEFSVTFVVEDVPFSPSTVATPCSQSPASTASYISASTKHKSAFEGLTTEEVVAKEKTATGTGSYRAERKGTVVLQWDNGFSWMNSKVVSFRAMKM